jgi:hypothetical protein
MTPSAEGVICGISVIWLQARAKLAGGHGTALARVARCSVRLRKSQSEQGERTRADSVKFTS